MPVSDHRPSTEAFASAFKAKLALSYLPALDGIRAVAVFLVIFYHFGFSRVPGGTGVTIFFVLSGFLITWLLLRENEKDGTISLKKFYRRRILRIFPAFYAYWLGLVLLMTVTGKTMVWPQAISALLYVTNYYNIIFGDPNTGFSHTWSLSIEEQFYLLWPFVFLWLINDLKKMTVLLVCIIIAVWIHRVILYSVFDVWQGYFYEAFDTRMDSLMMGCLVAVLLRRGVMMPFWKILCYNQFMPLIILALLTVSIYCEQGFIPRYRDVVGLAVNPLLIALFLVQMLNLSSFYIWRWIDWPVMRYLGRLSYSLYLYQQITLGGAKKLFVHESVLVQLIAAVAVTVIVAACSYHIIELPFLKLKNTIYK